MKCRFEEESLLKSQRTEEQYQRKKVSFPGLFLVCAMLGYAATFSSSCIWDRSKSCVAEVSKLPLQRPYIFQICMLLACYFGIMTLLAFPPAAWHRLPQKALLPCIGKWVSQVSGLASIAALLLISWVPSESKETHTLQTREGFLISLYFCLAAAHAYSTTYVRELIHQHEVVTQPTLWRYIRIWLARVLVLAVIIYLTLAGKKPFAAHNILSKCLGHLLFLCSFLYMGTYHEDISSVEVSLHSQDRFRHVSRATL